MKGLFNFIKKQSNFILVLLVLVIIQIICDFNVPKYTYQLIDTGIINDGVTEKVPTVIRRSGMKELTNYMTKEDKNKVLNSYSFINKKYEIYMKKYPILKDETIYLLNGERDVELSGIVENAIILLNNEKTKEISKIIPKVVIGEEETLEDVFYRLSEKEKEDFINQLEENKKDISEMTINDLINGYIKDEYDKVGFDLSNIRNEYITKTGVKIGLLLVLRIITVIYVMKKVSTISLNYTKNISKEILDKVSKLTYKEIKARDVKSLITKNPKDIKNLPILLFVSILLLLYISIFSIVNFIALNNTFQIMLGLILIGIELLTILLITSIICLIIKKLRKIERKRNILITLSYSLMLSIPILLLITVVVGIILACSKIIYIKEINMNIGELLALIGYTLEITIIISLLIILVVTIYQIIKSTIKINKIMKSEEFIKEPNKPKKFRKNAKHFVEFKNVNSEKVDNVNLSNINFKIHANSIFGVLCSNKEEGNHLTKLLLKLNDVKSGSITIDGIDINDVEIRDLRTKIYCFYPKNFWYYEEDLESTKFLKSPDIYILNDFNNDLDLESNEALNYFITKKAKNKIIIIVSTNINNLVNADKLAVIEHGKLVGLGKHKELINTCKEYQKIINE